MDSRSGGNGRVGWRVQLLLAIAAVVPLAACVAGDDSCDVDNGGCDSHASCALVEGEATCSCSDGWSGDGVACADIDECVSDAAPCDSNASCLNTEGSYSCSCDAGFTGDGTVCTDIDECVDGTAACDPLATCANTEGAYTCTCPAGYDGDGTVCTDIDECLTGQDLCDPVAACANTEGAYTCTCPAGYVGDGFTCEEVAASLDGLRWELPCNPSGIGQTACPNDADTFTDEAVLSGAEGSVYDLTLRIRGVVEAKTYSGAESTDGFFQVGGTAPYDGFNVYSLTVSEPAQVYYLNQGTSNIYYCFGLDYTVTIPAAAGATLTLFADNANGDEIANHDEAGNPIYVPDIDPWPDFYDGQFVQMDVVSVQAQAAE